MKRSITIIVFFFFQGLVLGQNFTAAIQPDRGNVMYTTIPNSFILATSVPFSDIECTIDRKGIIEKQATAVFLVTVPEPGYYKIKVTQRSTGASISYSYRAKNLPIPKASISGSSNDSISAFQLAKVTELRLVYDPGFEYNISAELSGFSVLQISNNNTRLELKNVGAAFSNDIKDLFRKSSPGDIFIFKNIKGRGPDPQELKIPDMLLYIK